MNIEQKKVTDASGTIIERTIDITNQSNDIAENKP